MTSLSPNTVRILGAIGSAIFAGLAFYFPDQAPAFASASAYVAGAVFHKRPGDIASGK